MRLLAEELEAWLAQPLQRGSLSDTTALPRRDADPDAPQIGLPAGTRVAGHRIVRLLGAGGMAGVDVVIGFTDEIPAWGAPYAFLLNFYREAARGVDPEEAARKAAATCAPYCERYLEPGKAPMTETLRVVVAPGVRRAGRPLTLFPARHGNSRN